MWSHLRDQWIVRSWWRGLDEQLILTDRLLDDRLQIAGGCSGIEEIGTPRMAGADQQPLCAGDRDVSQSVLGQLLLTDESLLVVDYAGIGRLGELGDRLRVPTQIRR